MANQQGTIKRLVSDKGFGFIQAADGTEYFFHQSACVDAPFDTLREGQTDFFIGADLPGVGYMLNFFSWLPDEKLVGTAGRAVDHVGFEVRDLQAFCAELERKGIALTQPYRKSGNLATAMLADPWGTSIELTEGLRDLP